MSESIGFIGLIEFIRFIGCDWTMDIEPRRKPGFLCLYPRGSKGMSLEPSARTKSPKN